MKPVKYTFHFSALLQCSVHSNTLHSGRNGVSYLKHAFWMSSWQREQYLRFGSVVIFDTTFKTTSTGLPLGVFVGVDNNFRNVVFGMCFLADESTESFEWLFKVFLEGVCNRPPHILVTDQDAAMSAARTSTLPMVIHRLCCWHLDQNLTKTLLAHGKEEWQTVRGIFWELANNHYSTDEFDDKCACSVYCWCSEMESSARLG